MDVDELITKGKKWISDLFGQESPSSETTEEVVEKQATKGSLGDQLAKRGLLTGTSAGASIAEEFGMEVYETLPDFYLPIEIYKKVPYAFVKRHRVLPFKEEEETIVVAVDDPLNLEPLENLRLLLNQNVRAVYASKDEILNAINTCYNKEYGEASQLIADLTGDGEDDEESVEVYDLLDESSSQAPIVKILNLILTEAIQQGASDIHFEPHEKTLRVRYRIDGVLHNRHSPAQEFQSQLMTRIKVMSKLDIAERRLPQDGRIKLKMGPRQIDFRVSTVPVVKGERIVLRILEKGNVMLGLEHCGMIPEVYKEFKRMISLPEGIVLVTGPTGSGKTTTLYSAVSDLFTEESNIMTIEDPVEYNLEGIAQIAVRHKIDFNFAAGLRTILRQDPDIVMVGEIRDVETAEIAIQASLTGHLVLSTLHTNDAPSSLTRLVDMGVEPYLLSSSMIGVLAQRLVRTICPNCKTSHTPEESELKKLGLTTKDIQNGKISKGKGCSECFESGFKGRHGVFELMTMNNLIQNQVVASPDAVELRRIALDSGMIPLKTHAAKLVLDGITTIPEALRVIRGTEE